MQITFLFYSGMYSFKSVERTGLTNLAQTCMDIGARWSKVNVNDI